MNEDLPPGLTRPRAVVFDWDNTLIDSWHAIQDAQNYTLEAFGLQPWTLEETRQRVRGSMRDSYPTLFGTRCPCAVCSNKKGDYLRREAEYLGWSALFGRIVGAFDAPRDKPAADPVLLALDGSGIAPGGDVWFAGDADIDLQCAVNAGCVPVLVREHPPEPGEFPFHAPAVHVEGCMMLSKVFGSM